MWHSLYLDVLHIGPTEISLGGNICRPIPEISLGGMRYFFVTFVDDVHPVAYRGQTSLQSQSEYTTIAFEQYVSAKGIGNQCLVPYTWCQWCSDENAITCRVKYRNLGRGNTDNNVVDQLLDTESHQATSVASTLVRRSAGIWPTSHFRMWNVCSHVMGEATKASAPVEKVYLS
jgi:hypothetical protein